MKNKSFWGLLLLLVFPAFLWASPEAESHHPTLMLTVFEWLERIADIVGIAILAIGFLRGFLLFLQLEWDRLRGQKEASEIFALRNVLGSYIIIALDFLIVSDIVHSVVSPELDELFNLGIIVVLRTAIGHFLGKELQELRHELKEEEEHPV
ncbi:DUF1622 domain-containing protein [Saprospira grandis]|uniref:DUF1622 domain-containing protein n=1 Tax=Saprospira grandis (strain Lewin) TaxID=984262 RepID=H6L2M5_SAPGL|nr:DUF1622 domain-containing protein [Saprospira grandis]AFC24782.1 hypothetical protein SGRA_2051 [Saprospira grandis str. Lewin]WBM76179.1 DUF1622 domain-containing protein [Saprospira grandis]